MRPAQKMTRDYVSEVAATSRIKVPAVRRLDPIFPHKRPVRTNGEQQHEEGMSPDGGRSTSEAWARVMRARTRLAGKDRVAFCSRLLEEQAAYQHSTGCASQNANDCEDLVGRRPPTEGPFLQQCHSHSKRIQSRRTHHPTHPTHPIHLIHPNLPVLSLHLLQATVCVVTGGTSHPHRRD